jgi:tight adherence protein B
MAGANDWMLSAALATGACAAMSLFLAVCAVVRRNGAEAPLVRHHARRKRPVQALAALLLAAAGMAVALPGGPVAMAGGAAAGALAGWFLPVLFRRMRLSKMVKTQENQIPPALDLLANGMRAGMSFVQAWGFAASQTPAPFGEEMVATKREIDLGLPLEKSLENMRRRVESEDMDLTVASIRLTLSTGGDLPNALAIIAATVRARAAMRRRINALTAQGRLEAGLVAIVPLAMLGITYSINPVQTSLLWTTGWGWFLLIALGAMDVLGFFAIQWICAIKM